MHDSVLDARPLQQIREQRVELIRRQHLGIARRRSDHQHELAARFQLIGLRCQIADRAPQDLLVELCQLAADRGLSSGQAVCEIRQTLLHAVAGLEHHQRRLDARQLGQPRASRLLLGRQEAFEKEAIGRQRRHAQGGQHRRGAGQCGHGMTGPARFAHQLVAGIRNQRRAGIGHERDGGTFGQALQDPWPHGFGIVLVIGGEFR